MKVIFVWFNICPTILVIVDMCAMEAVMAKRSTYLRIYHSTPHSTHTSCFSTSSDCSLLMYSSDNCSRGAAVHVTHHLHACMQLTWLYSIQVVFHSVTPQRSSSGQFRPKWLASSWQHLPMHVKKLLILEKKSKLELCQVCQYRLMFGGVKFQSCSTRKVRCGLRSKVIHHLNSYQERTGYFHQDQCVCLFPGPAHSYFSPMSMPCSIILIGPASVACSSGKCHR